MMRSVLSYPDIEARAVYRSHRVEQVYSGARYQPPETVVDLLEVGIAEETVFWKESVDHESLVDHFQRAEWRDTVAEPVLRILFLSKISLGDAGAELFHDLGIFQSARLHPTTAHWMQDRLKVSPIFTHCITAATKVLKTGSISFLRRGDKGEVISIDGFYVYSSGLKHSRAHVWFSHNLKTGSSTYILDNCPVAAKGLILHCAFGEQPSALGRPCAIDAMISDDCGQSWGEEILALRNELLRYEHMRIGLQQLSPADTSAAVENLHHISQNFHRISGDITDLEDRLEFLRDVHKKCMTYSPGIPEKESVAESLQFLASRTRIWKRWAMNYKDRTEIRINLFFNLATQNDNRTNLDIASFTSKIAVDTQRDSSSMITIAVVTMFFLPGTFVSTLFSMVFFDSRTDQNGRVTLAVAPQWWYFLAITIPLTIIVFLVWVLWQRWRNSGVEIGNNYESGMV